MRTTDLVREWERDAEHIDNHGGGGSHVKAVTLRVCARQLEALDGQLQLINSPMVSGNLAILDSLPAGAVVYMPSVDGDEPAVWIKYVSHVDGQQYWRGTEPGVSKTSKHLATFCTPLEILR